MKHHQHHQQHACCGGHCHNHNHGHEEEGTAWWKPAVSLGVLIVGILMSATGVAWFQTPYVRLLWYVLAFLPVGLGVIHEAIESARGGDVFSEFMLMSVASIGAFCIGEYPEAVAVMVFYCIGEALQDRAVDRARDHIKSLVAFRPDVANVVEADGKISVKSPEDVKIGDFIEVKAGERVPLDGELISSDTAFNTAALTGESIPQLIRQGREVLAGMIATDSVARLRVVRPAGQSAISRILTMVEEATERKAPAEQFIRRFARIYTPTVMGLALLTAVLPVVYYLLTGQLAEVLAQQPSPVTQWVYRALIFLVISCPCALVISIPLSYFAGIGAASRRGILFKGGNYLDVISQVETVAFDKTGTLTTGQFAVQQTEGLGEADLAVVAAIEQTSTHPIAQTIVKYVRERYPQAVLPSGISSLNIPGYGLSANMGEDRWLVGTLRLLGKEGVACPKALNDVPETLVAVAKNGLFIGHLLLSDTPKADAAEAISRLTGVGIHTEVLSGDKQALVDKLAANLGISQGYGDLLPQDKVAHIEALRQTGKSVAFVGDGINDAPVLALSDVGIAMGGLGSDMAIETADVVIQTDQPSRVGEAIAIGRRTRRIVRENIIFAIGVKLLIMILGLLGLTNLWAAVFADVGVALLAVLNALRIFIKNSQ